MFSSLCACIPSVVAMLDARLAAYAAIGAVAGVVLFYRGFRMLQFKRLVLNTPFSKIRSASMGLVEVSGTAIGPQTIPAGITGAPCYYYCATAWELKESGNSREWKKVAEETLYVPFFVDDSSGRLLVDPQGADLDVHRTFKDEFSRSLFGGRDMFPENVTNFLARNGIGGSGNIRLEEHCIEPGYPLFILGTLAENPTPGMNAPAPHVTIPSSSIRWRSSSSFFSGGGNGLLQAFTGISTTAFTGATKRIPASRTSDLSSRPIAASTSPAAGDWSSVSMDDAPPVRNTRLPAPAPRHDTLAPAASAAVATAVAERSQDMSQERTPAPSQNAGFDTHPPVVLTKGTGNDPFAISSESQRDVVRALAWKSAACIWGGPLLTLISFYVLSQVLGW
jgi:E3 Ubiquitin ligase